MKIKILQLLLFFHLSFGSSPPFIEDTNFLELEDEKFRLSKSTIETRDDTLNYRLPETLKPFNYVLELEPDFDNDIYSGNVEIQFAVQETTDEIVIHKKELYIDADQLSVVCDGTSYQVQSTNETTTDQYFYTILLQNRLEEGTNCTLTIGYFNSAFNTDNNGFYLAKYTDEDGNEQKFGMTKFEPTHARRAFPCFDEPALKATFVIRIIRPSDYTSDANTPLSNSSLLSDGRYLDEFKETVVMSTYLVAWLVSKLGYTEQLERHRVIAVPAEINSGHADYGLDRGYRSILALEEYTGIEYALDKMDQLAVPDGYFSSGAMENWGLVSYRRLYILYYNESTTITYRQYINTIINHEFAHQWFGNLVSPLWWSYIWLNEGFASYFEYYTTSLVEPTWEMMEQFTIKSAQYAMVQDSLATTRHMNKDAQTPTEISGLFDRVAYDKSAAVIYMLEAILTHEIFRTGLNRYLNNKKFESAEPMDLYKGLQEAGDESGQEVIPDGLNVSQIMQTWDSIAGYPVLSVIRNYEDGSVTFSQERFLLKDATYTSDDVWYIPINYATTSSYDFSDTSTEFFLTEKSASKRLSLSSDDWLIINKQETGYYRVNYDEDNWDLIIAYLNSSNYGNVHKVNRAQIIDDAFNLARSGRLSYRIPLNLMSLFSRDTDYIPLYSFLTALSFVDGILASTDVYQEFQNHVASLLETAYNELGMDESEDDPHTYKFNRPNVVNWICTYGHSTCRESALERLRQWEDTGINTISVTLEAQVLCGAMRIAEESDWDFVYQQYAASNDSLRKTRYLNALACSENAAILQKYMNLAIDTSSVIESGDRSTVFSYIYTKGNLGLYTEFEYISENLEAILAVTSITSAISGIGEKFTTEEQLSALKALQDRYSSYASIFTTAISNAEENIEWCSRYRSEIISWVSSLSSEDDSTDDSSGGSGSTASVYLRLSLYVILLIAFARML